MNKKAVALIVIAFFFLILEKQVEASQLRQLSNIVAVDLAWKITENK